MKKIFELLIIIVLLIVLVFIGKNKLATFYSNQGYDYYESASYDKAIEYFKSSLKLDPLVSTVHYNLAKAYESAGLTGKAEYEYRKAIQLDASFTRGYEALANIYFEQKSYKKAIAVLKEAEASASGPQEMRQLISHVSSEYTAHLINTAMDAFSKGDKPKAYALLNKALKANPTFPFLYHTLGYFYYVDEKYDKAVEKLNKAIQIDNTFFPAHQLLGDIYFEERSFNKAVKVYEMAASINRNDATLLNNLGLAFMNLENYQEAINILEEAVSLDPQNTNFRYSLASVYRDAGRLKESGAEYIKIINKQFDYPNAHNDLADVYVQESREDEAIREYTAELDSCLVKLQANPNDPLLLNSAARAYNGIGEYDKAKISVKKALAIKPDYRQAYLTLANIQNNLCAFEDSMLALKQAKALSPQRLYFIEKAINNVRGLKFFPNTVVYLKNKRRFEGIVKRETKDAIILEIDIGSSVGTVTLPRDDIERIASMEE